MWVSQILCKYSKFELFWIYNRNCSYYYDIQGTINKGHDNENVKQKNCILVYYYIIYFSTTYTTHEKVTFQLNYKSDYLCIVLLVI